MLFGNRVSRRPGSIRYGILLVLAAVFLSLPVGAQEAMSADRIITILQQNPELLASLRNMAAQKTASDPSTISDETIFDRIRQEPASRAQIASALKQRGYDTSEDPAAPPTSTAKANSPAAKATPQATKPDATGGDDEPQVLHRPAPFPSLPSLFDLYSQYPSDRAKLKRFGSDVFRFGTGNAEDVPMDLPAGPDYILGPGDGLVLNLWGFPHTGTVSIPERSNRTIDRQGQISIPEVGTIAIAGQSLSKAREAIENALGTQFKGIRVDLSLARLRSVRVYVVGDVQRPGAYDLSSLSTALNALYAAGGPTSRGSLRIVRHLRGQQLIGEVDLYEFLLRGVRANTDRLLPGDTILVPPAGPQVAVNGMVRRPAIYELKGEQSLRDVLDLAGGVLVAGALQQLDVERIEAHQRRTMLTIDLPENGTGEEAAQVLATFKVQDGDSVLVVPILPYNERAIYLEGHVFRPGRYAYHDGITVNDVLRSYQDVLPEPADHVEIIRLQSPDLRPMTMTLSLSEVLRGDDPVHLLPFDVIRIFGRYEQDPPMVTIEGEVLRPGIYPLAQGMTVIGLLEMAGGFKRSAFREEVDLASYVVQNGTRILTTHKVVQIAKAQSGDKGADVTLRPGDIVSIRQLTGWQDIGAVVTVGGEVAFPGTYGISEGERLSSLLRRVGGFRVSAYPAGAVLERVQVRELGEKARMSMIRRIETASPTTPGSLQSSTEQMTNLQVMEQQRQRVLQSLRSQPASGRQVVRISAAIEQWENTPADIQLRSGDVLTIPKRPNFVFVTGQVFNTIAISYVPGKNAEWYLRQAGGLTQSADRKNIFVLRADGSAVAQGSAKGILWTEGALSMRLSPGDAVIVPERIKGGSSFWREALAAGQIFSSVGLTAAVALK